MNTVRRPVHAQFLTLSKSNHFITFLGQKHIAACKVREGVIDFEIQGQQELPASKFDGDCEISLLRHQNNGPSKEFWFAFAKNKILIFSLQSLDKTVKFGPISEIDLGCTLKSVISISGEYFIGIVSSAVIQAFTLSKTGPTWFKQQPLSFQLKSTVRRLGSEYRENLQFSVMLNSGNLEFMFQGNQTPEVILFGTHAVYKARFKNFKNHVLTLLKEDESVLAFRFLEALMTFKIKYFWGAPDQPKQRTVKVFSSDSGAFQGTLLGVFDGFARRFCA